MAAAAAMTGLRPIVEGIEHVGFLLLAFKPDLQQHGMLCAYPAAGKLPRSHALVRAPGGVGRPVGAEQQPRRLRALFSTPCPAIKIVAVEHPHQTPKGR